MDIHTHVPVIIDDIKVADAFRMCRCTYFSIECDEPEPNWALNGMPFYMLGLSGIVIQPISHPKFVSPTLIVDLFEYIEGINGFFVDTNDIWLPLEIFQGTTMKRGSVYRVDLDIFRAAYYYRNGKISREIYEDKCLHIYKQHSEGDMPAAYFSESETVAFNKWAVEIIGKAKAAYPKDKELALKWNN